MYARTVSALAAASFIAGCAIHPVPEDVTGVDTSGIVKQIRCETRDAARKTILRVLHRLANEQNNEVARVLLADFTDSPDQMVHFNPNKSFPNPEDVQIRNLFNFIYSTAIAYSFDLTMLEDNDLGSTLNFLGPWQSTFKLGVTGNSNRSRQNQRTFAITDQFSFLLRELNTADRNGRQYCDGKIVGPNYVYPIAGEIGVYKTIHTFFQLSLYENLTAGGEAGSKSPPLADKLIFVTDFNMSATPTITFSPLKSNFQLTDATATGKLGRKDTHEVILGIASDTTGAAASADISRFTFSGAAFVRPPVVRGRPNANRPLELNRVVGVAPTRASEIALGLVDRIKSQEVFFRPYP